MARMDPQAPTIFLPAIEKYLRAPGGTSRHTLYARFFGLLRIRISSECKRQNNTVHDQARESIHFVGGGGTMREPWRSLLCHFWVRAKCWSPQVVLVAKLAAGWACRPTLLAAAIHEGLRSGHALLPS